MQVQRAQNEPFTPGYSLARYLLKKVTSVMYFHQSSDFQNTNGLQNTVKALTAASFPQVFPRIPRCFTAWQCVIVGNKKPNYCHVLPPATAQRDQCHS